MNYSHWYSEIRFKLIRELVDVGDLIPKYDDYYEDMGGHILHESNLDHYIESYLGNLNKNDLKNLMSRLNT